MINIWEEFWRRYYAELEANLAAWRPIVGTRHGAATLI